MSSRRSAVLTCVLPAVLCLFSSLPAFAQKSEAQIQDDISFAKGLAKQWGFVDLAGEVIKAIEREGVSRKTAEELGVAKCEIYAQAAIAERDRTKRNVLFESAISAYEDFLEKNPNSEAAAEAEIGYINMSSAFARSLEISLEEALGEEAETLRLRRIEILTAAVSRTGELISNLKAIREATEAQKRERGNMMLMRGRMLMELGRSQKDGDYSFAQAIVILEEVVFDQGEGSPNALRAYDLIGQVYSAQEDWEQASIYFEAVIEQALPADPAAWALMVKELELGPGDKEQRWLFVELSTAGLCDSMMAVGEVENACKYALHLYNTQRREGFSYSITLGYPSLLVAARTLLDAGGIVGGNLGRGEAKWFSNMEQAADAGVSRRNRLTAAEVALTIAQQVVEENAGNVLRVRGQNLIADITSRPGAVIDPSVLYQAAEGKYNAKENAAALVAFKRVLATLENRDKATRLEFSPKTFYYMGRSYQRLGRHAEACMAFREGCTTWIGDPAYDSFNATGYYKSAQELQNAAPGDALILSMFEDAEKIAAALSERGKDQILFDIGEKERKINKNYDAAIEQYKLIQKSAPVYEPAMVNTGVCKFRQKKNDEALAIFVEYLDNYVTDELNSTGGSAIKEAKRLDAMASAGFYRALIEYAKEDFQGVIDHARDYYTSYPEQTVMAPWTMRLVGNSLTKTGKVDEAKAYLQTALGIYPDNKHIASFAIEFYKELVRQLKAATDPEQKRALLREMALLLEIGNKAATQPSFGNLRAESKHWFDLQEWEKARVILELLNTKFSADEKYQKDFDTYVFPDLAHVYLALHRAPEAAALLGPLVATGASKKPSKRTLLDYTRSVIGWIEGDAVDIQEVPGAGTTPEEFKDATEKLDALANGVDEKWTCEWYELKLQLAYGYYTWATSEGGPRDSTKKDTAKRQLNALIQELGPQFRGGSGVPGVGQSCDEDPERAAALGTDVLRRRLVWLWGNVR